MRKTSFFAFEAAHERLRRNYHLARPSIAQVASAELVLFDPKSKAIGVCFSVIKPVHAK
jgi:hypothetical protein